jgi:hypothetical protein
MFSAVSTLFLLPLLSTLAATSPTFGLIGPQNALLQLNGFHFISGEPDHYLHANHHCAIMSTEFIQCAIYVPDSEPARLAGIEYIITASAFARLDDEEKQLWHSHRYEVLSGYLVQPGLPETVDDAVMQILGDSYGKTWHTWRYDQKNNTLPLGIPELVNGYTGAGQLTPDFVTQRDEDFGINSTAISEHRAQVLNVSDVLEGADSWTKGYVLNLGITNHTADTEFSEGGKKKEKKGKKGKKGRGGRF